MLGFGKGQGTAALEVASLNADDPIAMLAANPDRFLGRTTKAPRAQLSARRGGARALTLPAVAPLLWEGGRGVSSLVLNDIVPPLKCGYCSVLASLRDRTPRRPRRPAALAGPALRKPLQLRAVNPVAAPAQALDVTAEPDRPPLRTESRPPGGAANALARAWPAIGGAALAALLLAGAGLALARRRQRPLMDALLERCRLGRRRAGWQPQVPP